MVLKINSECTVTSYTAEIGWETVSYPVVPPRAGSGRYHFFQRGKQRTGDQGTGSWVYKLANSPTQSQVPQSWECLIYFLK